MFFVDPEARLVVMDLMFSSNKVIRLVAIYALNKTGQSEYYRNLEIFLYTSHTLTILD